VSKPAKPPIRTDASVALVPRLALTLDEIAASTGIGARTLRAWIAGREFPVPDLARGKVHRWRVATIDAWLAAGAPGDWRKADTQ
jgi:predicted DNA-binding transcriptional regulator AlpA